MTNPFMRHQQFGDFAPSPELSDLLAHYLSILDNYRTEDSEGVRARVRNYRKILAAQVAREAPDWSQEKADDWITYNVMYGGRE